MMITKHNYEEYFLLYIDDELTAAERIAVENFVGTHPQYATMLATLQDTKLPDTDTISFLNKESLLKDEAGEIGINNYEEYFLLHTDNELSDEQKETTERFVLQHPQLQESFVLLQQTKLPPEVIEYKNKEELYRKERRVLPLYIAGLSVAAAVFAVMFFAGLFTSGQQPDNAFATATVHQDNQPDVQPSLTDTQAGTVVTQQHTEIAKNVLADKISNGKTEQGQTAGIRTVKDNARKVMTAPVQRTSGEETAVAPEDAHPSQPAILASNSIERETTTLKPLEELENDQANTATTLSLADNNMVQHAVYKELDTDEDNHTLYVSGVQINKNKVNGLLKSASRLLGGRTRQSEE